MAGVRVNDLVFDDDSKPSSPNSLDHQMHCQKNSAIVSQIDNIFMPGSMKGKKHLQWEMKISTPQVNFTSVVTRKRNVPTWLVTSQIPGIDQLPTSLQDICLAYTDDLPEVKVGHQYPIGTFFVKYASQTEYLQHRLEEAANDLLNGNVTKAVTLVKMNKNKEAFSNILNMQTQGKDRHKRQVRGTLLDIAAIAEDMNLYEPWPDEKPHGAVEQLAEAGGLSFEDLRNRLSQTLFSPKAEMATKKREKLALAALKEFAEKIIARENLSINAYTPESLKKNQEECAPEIKKLRQALIGCHGDVITSGYLFPSSILFKATQWFAKRKILDLFGGWLSTKSILFWINGYGSLQWAANARTAQICYSGIQALVFRGELSSRSLQKPREPSFFSPGSELGLDFFLSHSGNPRWGCWFKKEGWSSAPDNAITPLIESWATHNSQKPDYSKIYAMPEAKKVSKCLIM